MCGICGYILKNVNVSYEDINEYKLLLNDMQKALQHRGPDDYGIIQENEMGLGHRRLSIVDLSKKGHQPMTYMNRYVITYNGEIYNYIELREQLKGQGYIFSTNTDTEVLLAAYACWKEKCLEKLNGMWAFAIWDKKEQILFCARDRFGVKPFYYHVDDRRILFASEIKALLKDSKIDRIANGAIVYDYLTQGLVEHTNETFFEGIYKLPPSTYMIIKAGQILVQKKYYDVEFSKDIVGKITEEEIDNFTQVFQSAVKMRLRADVSVGSCLSGGLDSSAIVCSVDKIIKEQKRKVEQHTFSFCTEDKRIDERKYMDAVTKETNTIPHQVFSDNNELLDEIQDLIYTQEEPFSSTGMYASYCVYRLARKNNVVVLLDGQGADEILCGYRKSRIYYIKRLLKNKKILRAIKEGLCSFSQVKGALFIKNDLYKIKRIIFSNKKTKAVNDFLTQQYRDNVKGYDYKREDDFQYNDLFKISLPALLRYADKNSMAFSVESRLPYLDYRFVEICSQLSLNKKIKNGISKYIMRQALEMPECIRKRRDKIGFATPEDVWIKNSSDSLLNIFKASNFRTAAYIDRSKVIDNWDDIIYKNKGTGLFRYVCLELWARKFDVICKV